MNSDRLNGIRAFVQAAQSGGFSLAAAQLGLSRSTVGKAIARLESRLQVQLFQRTTRTLSLTAEGEQFYQECLSILAQLDAAENRLSAHAREPTGRLRVTMPPLFGEKWAMPVLLDLMTRWPQLAVDIIYSSQRLDLAEEGIDLAIRIGDPGHHVDLTARELGHQALVLCAAPAYLQRCGTPDCWQDLAQHQHITLLDQGRSQAWRLRTGADEIIHWPPTERLRMSHMSAVQAAVIQGAGIAQLPHWLVAEAIASGKLTALLPQYQPPGLPIYAVWLKTPAMPLRLRVTIDALVAALGTQSTLRTPEMPGTR